MAPRALLPTRRSRPSRSGSDGLDGDVAARLDQYRGELTGYCYRMLGSGFEAEDAVQEVLLRAWRGIDRFEGRSALRSWLYSIATNVCLDMLGSRQRRAMPMDLAAPSGGTDAVRPPLPESTWVQPIPDGRALPRDGDPAEVAVAREGLRLALVAALQHLPPRQRAVLILRDVLRWRAEEVADLLDTSQASVKSLLQRARVTVDQLGVDLDRPAASLAVDDDERRRLLDRYVDAFARFDIDALVSLLHEDATMTMPPNDFWLRGADAIHAWWTAGVGRACGGGTLLPVAANGAPAFAAYRADGSAGSDRQAAFAIQVLEVVDGRIAAIHAFLDPGLFPLFGLPRVLDTAGTEAAPIPS